MKLERTKNAKRNIIFGIVLKIYQLLVPFAMRTALVYYLGEEYLGLSSFFTSILSVLNLAELGVGSALVFSMYKPIAEDDEKTICALMKLYKLYYRLIGLFVLLAGMALVPVLPMLIKGNLPSSVNLYVLYFINLGASVLSYWLFAYKNALLTAHQRNDVSSKIQLIMNSLLYIVQFTVLALFRNYYFYILLTLVNQVLINIITAFISTKMYPSYSPKGVLEKTTVKAINRKVRDLFTARLGGTIINSADSVVISAFLGLVILGRYNNYYYIMFSIIGFATVGYESLTAGIGNSLVTESDKKNYNDFKTILYIAMGCTCVCASCLLNLFQPFMKIWMGEKRLLDMGIVICMCVYFVVYEFNAVLNLFKDAAGMWHQDRFRPLVVALSNLFLNIISVKVLGLYGVLLSTVVTMAFIGIPWVSRNLFKNIFKKEKMSDLIKRIFGYLIIIVLVSFITYELCAFLPENILGIIVRLCVCIVVSVAIYMIVTIKVRERKAAIALLKRLIIKK